MRSSGIAIGVWIATSVCAAAQVATDGTAGPERVIAGPDYDIGADLGTLAGGNLFHSFETFSIGTGESATFSGPADIDNVISRVTGGARSDIDGALRSTIAGADFFFINPAGVLFGPNASLQVGGSFHVSTADQLSFDNGEVFSAADPDASSFSVAAPEAFGFLGARTAGLTVDQSLLLVPDGADLSLIGGDVEIKGGQPFSFIAASAGMITIAAVRGPGEIGLSDPAAVPPTEHLGAVRIIEDALVFSGLLNPGPDGSTGLRVHGATILVDDAQLSVDNFTDQDLVGEIALQGGEITIRNSDVTADALAAGSAAGIRIDADVLTLEQGGLVRSETLADGAAGAIDVTVRGASLTLDDQSRISTTSFGGGAAGRVDVRVASGDLVITDDSQIASAALGTGAGGAIEIDARRVVARGGEGTVAGIVTLAGFLAAGAGAIDVTADAVELRDGGVIAGTNAGPGPGGTIAVTAPERLVVTGPLSRIDTTTTGFGAGGTIVIDSGALELGPGGLIASGTTGPGAGGAIDITAEEIAIRGASLLEPAGVTTLSGGPGAGPAGRIDITTGQMEIGADGSLTAGSSGAFDAGPITVTVTDGDLVLDGGVITNSTLEGARGAAGTITIQAQQGALVLGGGASIASNNRGSGGPGQIRIDAGSVHIEGGSEIAAGTTGEGDGGLVDIVAADRVVIEDGRILSSARGAGRAGAIQIRAGHELRTVDGTIASDSSTSGGGQITLQVGDLIDLLDSEVTTSVVSDASATAGDISIDPTFLVVDGSRIVANAAGGTGGNIRIVADNLLVSPESTIEASGAVSGTVDIITEENNVTDRLVTLNVDPFDVSSLLRERCAARRDVGASSFTGVGRPGLPPSPDGPLSGAPLAVRPTSSSALRGSEVSGLAGAAPPSVASVLACHGPL